MVNITSTKTTQRNANALLNGRDRVHRDARPAFVVEAEAVPRVRHAGVFQEGRVLVDRDRALGRHRLQRVHVDQAANFRQHALTVGHHRHDQVEMLTYVHHLVVRLRTGSSRVLVTLQIGQGRPAFRPGAPQYQHADHQQHVASADAGS